MEGDAYLERAHRVPISWKWCEQRAELCKEVGRHNHIVFEDEHQRVSWLR
jgi:hypothetical protein